LNNPDDVKVDSNIVSDLLFFWLIKKANELSTRSDDITKSCW